MAKTKPKSDDDIVREYWERDEKAVEDTARRYEDFIYRVIRRILRDTQTARECVNDVYLKMWSSIPPNRPSNLEAYLSRIARSVAVDRLRSETRQKRGGSGIMRSLDDYRDLLTTESDVPDEAAARALAETLNRFLRNLSARDRACFVKRFYYACTISDIVTETGLPRITVYRTLGRVKKQLKEVLEDEGYLS